MCRAYQYPRHARSDSPNHLSLPTLPVTAQISPLIDALGRNASLTHLDLSLSGITYGDANASGEPLVAMMATFPAALSALGTLVVSRESNFRVPTQRLRAGVTEATAALRSLAFLMPGGPWREDVLFMGDLLRSNRNANVVERSEEVAGEAVARLLGAAAGGKLKRDQWETQLKTLMVEGSTRRGHLLVLIAVDTLRDVGFLANELLEVNHSLPELKAGGYKAGELRQCGMKAMTLRGLDYTAREMRLGGYKAAVLKAAGYSAAQLKEGGFMCRELKGVGYSAVELKGNGFTCTELREGSFSVADLKPLGYTVAELRTSGFAAAQMLSVGFALRELKEGMYSASELREANNGATDMRTAGFSASDLKGAGYSGAEMKIAGYSISEMKEAAFSAKKVRQAGYSAIEAIGVGWAVEVLKVAGFTAAELREAKCSAEQLKAVGFALVELRAAAFTAQQLQDAGCGRRSHGTAPSPLPCRTPAPPDCALSMHTTPPTSCSPQPRG